MRKETLEALTKYEKAWKKALHPEALSFIRVWGALSREPTSFSELVEKAGVSSSTLDKLLKKGITRGFISKKRQKEFPWKSTYAPTEAAYLLKLSGLFITGLDMLQRHLIEGAGEGKASAEEIIDETVKNRDVMLGLFFETSSSWLKDEGFEFIHALFSASYSIMFWGAFFALSFPHIKKKAKEILNERGIFSASEKQIFMKIEQARNF